MITSAFRILEQDDVGAIASPLRRDLLAALDEPDSASNLARRFDMSRQRVGYHMRELESAGCIELIGERQQRGLTEKLYRARPMAYVYAPVGHTASPSRRERYSWAALLNLLGGALWDLIRLRRRADSAGKRLATLALDAELTFPNPAARKAFTEDLITAVEGVIAKHEYDPGQKQDQQRPPGRSFRLVLGAYPAIGRDNPDSERSENHERIHQKH